MVINYLSGVVEFKPWERSYTSPNEAVTARRTRSGKVSETWLQKRPPGRNLGEHRLVRRSGATSRGFGIELAHAQRPYNRSSYHIGGENTHIGLTKYNAPLMPFTGASCFIKLIRISNCDRIVVFHPPVKASVVNWIETMVEAKICQLQILLSSTVFLLFLPQRTDHTYEEFYGKGKKNKIIHIPKNSFWSPGMKLTREALLKATSAQTTALVAAAEAARSSLEISELAQKAQDISVKRALWALKTIKVAAKAEEVAVNAIQTMFI
ncbi:hypothetical protein P5673_017719 [Acropora cervicornis]|uniref:Uncharacterized protein n=1 Tax=Acropora cervicornis TaxID=6130 RepID=A0AAD9V3A1_ACRCE|nr:hypothetical protein P5673_017719 [Acropora cervicornis]